MTSCNLNINPQILAAGIVSFILVGVGFHTGWTSPSLAKLQAEDSDISVTPDQGSWIASLILAGSLIGGTICVPMVSYWGRKLTLLILAVPMFSSCIIIAFATTYWWLYIARILAGCSIGMTYTAVPMYLGEIADDNIRGGLGILMTVLSNIGTLIAYSFGPWTSRAALASIGAIFPLIYVLTFMWMPESPYFYTENNDLTKAEESLAWLKGTHDVAEEIKLIQNNIASMRCNKPTIRDILTNKGNLKALGIICGLLTLQQFSGMNAFTSYSTIIFNEVDSGIGSSVSVIITGIVQLVTVIVLVFLTDRMGRRPLIVGSLFFCAVFLVAGGLYFHLRSNGSDVSSISWLPMTAFIGFLISFSGGIGTVPIAMTVEIFSLEIKAFAMMVSTWYLSGFGIGATKLYQIIADTYGIHIAFYMFSFCCIIGMFIVSFTIPETKGRSLSEIQDILNGRSKTKL